MAKDNVTQYSTTASSNTDIGGVNIDESCPPSGINNAIRELMKQTADWVSGSQAITALTVTGEVDAGSLDVSGQIDVDGVSYLDAVVVDGTVTVGVDDTGHDVKFYGDTASAYMQWDASSDDLILGGAAGLTVAGSAALNATTVTTLTASGAVSITGPSLVIGDNNASSNGYDSLLHLLGDGSSGYRFGVDSGNTELSLEREYNGWLDVFTVTRATGTTNFNSPINVGVDDTGHDVKFHGATSGRYMEWDESQDVLRLSDNVQLQLGTGGDLILYHAPEHSYIQEGGSGNLYIQGTNLYLQGRATGETMLGAVENGAVELYYDASKKIETTTDGVRLSDASSVDISTPLLTGADHTCTGLTAQMLAGGTISAFDLVCVHTTTGEVVEADASAYATARVIGIAPAAISDTATGTILLQGFIRDDSWSWTTGSTLYLSETAGAMTHTPPSTDGAFVNIVGVALEPDVVYINPSMDVIERA